MNKQITKISSAANNYAKALDELAQSGAVNYDILDADMRTLYDVLSGSTDLQTVMENPSINIETKFDIINTIFQGKVSSEIINFLKILIEKKRISEFPQIYAKFKNNLYNRKNIQPATIVSAVKLNEMQKQLIVEKLSKKLNKTIISNWIIDNNIIAGIQIKIDDNILDLSLRHRIEKLNKSLILK